jgi:Fe-S-cluster containining protein
MEITLDVALVRRILRDERTQASAEIRTKGPVAALLHSQGRHDERIAEAPDVGSLACRTGCNWCCYCTVDVRPVEVFAIAEFVSQRLDAGEQARIATEVRDNSARLRALADGERTTLNLRCPFLVDGSCAVYPVRPQSCRNYHATDATGCQQSFNEPDNTEIDPDFAPGVYQAGAAHVEAFTAAMVAAGYDVDAYELNAALAAVLSMPDARTRFESGARPFPEVQGESVAAEFDDLAP